MTARFAHLDRLAAGLVADVLARPATLGTGRLVCVDGPAGSGKTTLAAALDRAARDALRPPGTPADRAHTRLLHMDNVYEGWTGMAAGRATMARDVVAPLREGRPGRYRRWDWHRDGYAEERVVEPVDVLVVEGVGSANPAYADATTCLVWVDTPSDVRLRRGLERDGHHLRDHWLAFSAEEDAMFARERTRDRADVVVDGTSGEARDLRP